MCLLNFNTTEPLLVFLSHVQWIKFDNLTKILSVLKADLFQSNKMNISFITVVELGSNQLKLIGSKL